MFYELEANIINWEISREPINYAKEFGNFIIHFSAKGKPVLIEILDASKFIGQFDKLKDIKKIKRVVPAS